MKTKFTKDDIMTSRGCYEKKDVDRIFPKKKKIVTLKDIINSKIPHKDKIWFLWNSCQFVYSEREECYNNSKKIQKIIKKYFPLSTFPGWVDCDFNAWFSFTHGSASEKSTTLNEILKYSKKFDK